MTQPLEVAATRDAHRANAARCRYEERRLRTMYGALLAATGTLHPHAARAAYCWRESAQEYDEMADFLDTVLAAEHAEAAMAAACGGLIDVC